MPHSPAPIPTPATDYFGKPYTAFTHPKKDYGKLWAEFRRRFRATVERDTAGQHGTVDEESINNYHEQQLLNHEKTI